MKIYVVILDNCEGLSLRAYKHEPDAWYDYRTLLEEYKEDEFAKVNYEPVTLED